MYNSNNGNLFLKNYIGAKTLFHSGSYLIVSGKKIYGNDELLNTFQIPQKDKNNYDCILLEDVDHNGADIWIPPKKCSTFKEFIQKSAIYGHPGTALMYNSVDGNLFLKKLYRCKYDAF